MADRSGTTNFRLDAVGAVPLAAFAFHPVNLAVTATLVATAPVLVWHLLYGLVLGGLLPVVGDR